ncbi:hypothetical protein [Cupriavidus basilensis]|nr:hypothetical protein [Cupriavidus basilensis]
MSPLNLCLAAPEIVDGIFSRQAEMLHDLASAVHGKVASMQKDFEVPT